MKPIGKPAGKQNKCNGISFYSLYFMNLLHFFAGKTFFKYIIGEWSPENDVVGRKKTIVHPWKLWGQTALHGVDFRCICLCFVPPYQNGHKRGFMQMCSRLPWLSSLRNRRPGGWSLRAATTPARDPSKGLAWTSRGACKNDKMKKFKKMTQISICDASVKKWA